MFDDVCSINFRNAFGLEWQLTGISHQIHGVQLPFVAKITTFDGQTTLWSPQGAAQNCTAGNSNAIQVVQVEDDAVASAVKQTIYVVKAPTS